MRIVSNHILEVYKDKKEMSFADVYHGLRDRGYKHYQGDISKNLQFLIKQGYLEKKVDGRHTCYQLIKAVE